MNAYLARTRPAFLRQYLILASPILVAVIGFVIGERYMKDGLVAAAGVHFWVDVVFHVLWGLI
jgi:hypothetical protein